MAVAVAGAAPVATRPAAARRRGRPSPLLVVTSLLVGGLFAGPFAYLAVRNASEGGDVVDVLTSRAALEPLARSVWLGLTVAAASAVLGTSLAWLLTRTDVPGRRAWQMLVPLPLVIPSFVGAASLTAAFARGGFVDQVTGLGRLPDVRGFTGAFMVLTLLSYPYVFLTVAARLRAMPPGLEESARLLGRRPWAVFRTVVLPQASGAIWAGSLLTFLYVLSDFGAVSIVRYDALTRAIYSSRLDPQTSVPLSLLLGLLALAVVAGERALGRRRPALEAGRAKRALTLPLRRWRWPVVAYLGTVVTVALVAPVTVLGWWAVRGLVNAESAVSSLATDPAALVEPVLRTAMVGLVTAVIAVAVVLPVARLSVRFGGRLAELPGALVVGGFALPGLVTALALVFWVLQLPSSLGLYQTLPVLVVAYVLHFGAQSLRAAQVAVAGVPGRVEDAARMLGARGTRRFVTVELPIMLPGLLAGAGMVLLSTMKELPATLLLAPTGFETLATRIWAANSEGFLAETGLTSLVLLVLSGVLTWFLVLRRAEHL